MGKMKFIKLLAILITAVFAIYLIIYSDYNNVNRKIYFRYNSKISFGYILGYLPSTYKLDYDENIFYNNDKYYLTNIIYNKFPSYHNYIILGDKETGEKNILKDSDKMFYKIEGKNDVLSSQINLIYFNQLIKYKNVKNKDSISDYFCYLLSDLNKNNYKPIRNKAEFRLLSNNKSLVNNIDKETIFSEYGHPNIVDFKIYWFKGFGFFKFTFKFDDVNLKNVNDEFLDYSY